MRGREGRARVITEWVAKAENDLTTAIHTLELGESAPTDTICFHVQQCVEKYVKAVLVHHDSAFPKTHDIEQLVALLPESVHVSLTPEEQADLTAYATTARYPGWDEIPLAEARSAVAIARRVRAELRQLLPDADQVEG